jgi:hypothetical protein
MGTQPPSHHGDYRHSHMLRPIEQWATPLRHILHVPGLLDDPRPLGGSPPRRTQMQSKLHSALKRSFESRGLPLPPRRGYRPIPRVTVHEDAPLAPWFCGTIAMTTTLHLLLGKHRPHKLPPRCISRQHMLALHRGLLRWLITGTPPNLWADGCLD